MGRLDWNGSWDIIDTKTGLNTNLYPGCSQSADAGLWILGVVSRSGEADVDGI